MSTTYTKLKDGSWGVRGPINEIVNHSSVVVTKKSGEQKSEDIEKILWTGNGIALASLVKRGRDGEAIRTDEHRRPVCSDCGKWTSGKYSRCYSCQQEEYEAM